jgi:hypothetical protein
MQMVIEPLFRLLLLSSSDSERNLFVMLMELRNHVLSCVVNNRCTVNSISGRNRRSNECRVTPVKRGKVARPSDTAQHKQTCRRSDAQCHSTARDP